MSDGRYDSARIYEAVRSRAQRAAVFDMDDAARAAGSMASAVAFGAIARTAGLPIARETFEEVIRKSGIAVASNLKGFAGVGLERAGGHQARSQSLKTAIERAPARSSTEFAARLDAEILRKPETLPGMAWIACLITRVLRMPTFISTGSSR